MVANFVFTVIWDGITGSGSGSPGEDLSAETTGESLRTIKQIAIAAANTVPSSQRYLARLSHDVHRIIAALEPNNCKAGRHCCSQHGSIESTVLGPPIP